jgi:hypothetical protein
MRRTTNNLVRRRRSCEHLLITLTFGWQPQPKVFFSSSFLLRPIFSKVSEEVEKGQHVKNQLKAWDLLLDCRIRIQKVVNVANRLHSAQILRGRMESTRPLTTASQAVSQEALGLVNEFLELKNEWPFQSATPAAAKKTPAKKRSREEFESDLDYAWHQIDTLNKRSGLFSPL